MRDLPVQYGTIRIASSAGEERYINVSGSSKAQLLWLFRNFYILDFPVLSEKQKQLIAREWHTGQSAGSIDARFLIGTIEGFAPQLHQAPVHHQPVPAPAPLAPAPLRRRTHFGLPSGLRLPAILTAAAVLLLCGTVGLWPKHRTMPQSQVVAEEAAKIAPRASDVPPATPTVVALSSVESAPPDADSPTEAAISVSLPPLQLPDAMARDASPTEISPPSRFVARAKGKPQVIIRVSIDRDGRAHAFHVMSGDQTKISAALNAAKHWPFQPCSASAECEHLLKFTDYGDASIVKIID